MCASVVEPGEAVLLLEEPEVCAAEPARVEELACWVASNGTWSVAGGAVPAERPFLTGLADTSELPEAVPAKPLVSRPAAALGCNIGTPWGVTSHWLPPALKPQTAVVARPASAEQDLRPPRFSGHNLTCSHTLFGRFNTAPADPALYRSPTLSKGTKHGDDTDVTKMYRAQRTSFAQCAQDLRVSR